MGVNVVQGEGQVLGGFCPPFSQREMPLGRWRRNVSDSYAKTSQHFRSPNISLESSIRGLFGDIFSSRSTLAVGVWEISKNVTTVLPNLQPTLQGCRRNMYIHEWTPRPTVSAGYSPPRRGPFPNYFGQTCYTCATTSKRTKCGKASVAFRLTWFKCDRLQYINITEEGVSNTRRWFWRLKHLPTEIEWAKLHHVVLIAADTSSFGLRRAVDNWTEHRQGLLYYWWRC